jgi:WD40 repeat protein
MAGTAAMAGTGGAAGAAGAPEGGVGGNSGGGGRGGSSAGAPPMPVDPEVSRAWTWQSCGSLRPQGADRAALFDASGNIVVLGPMNVRVHRATGEILAEGGPADFLVAAPDGSVLSVQTTATGIVLTPIGESTPLAALPLAPTSDCLGSFAFSADGDYLIASGPAKSCAWRLSDSTFVGSVAGEQVAIQASNFVVIERSAQGTEVVRRDFQGAELSRRKLGEGQAFLSPTGDRAILNYTLFDLDTGEVIAWDHGLTTQFGWPLFSPRGETVLVADGVFRASDGKRQFNVDPGSRLATDGRIWQALAPDGTRVVLSTRGRATVLDVESKGVAAVLGPPPLAEPNRGHVTSDLAISADGSLLVQNVQGFSAFGIAVAPSFSDSRVLWQMSVELNLSVDVSPDGHLVAIGGDGRAIYDGRDGRTIWPALPPPPEIDLGNICLLDRLRISPRGTWLAGTYYSGRLQVFDLNSAASSTAWPELVGFPRNCDTPAFSRDERLMATSAASLYSTGPKPGDWKQIWSSPLPVSKSGYEPSYDPARDVSFSPDETQLLVTSCVQNNRCTNTLLSTATGAVVRALPELDGQRPSFSPEGSWLVAAGKLLHLPSGEVRSLDADPGPIGAAIFTPGGDIIAGSADGTLTRYCRAP